VVGLCLADLQESEQFFRRDYSYYIDRYASVGAFLRIAPDSSGTLGVQTHLLQKGQQYSVYVTIKGTQPLEGPFKVQLPAAESEGT